MNVASGLDILTQEHFARCTGRRIALLANQASVDARYRHIVDALLSSNDLTLVRVFAPEHGFFGTKQDMEVVEEEKSVSNNATFEVVSLYGSEEQDLHPKAAHFKDIDLLIVDLPDIGARYYTFAQTMAYCMRVAAQEDVEVLVLDRPNPINGVDIEGTALLNACRSFCGYTAIPQRHGLTLGELATLYNAGFSYAGESVEALSCKLSVVACQGWKREMYFDQTGLPWIAPSVNMPTLDTAIVYPGMCLFEATALSEGRGTTKPFEYLGAPYIDGARWAEACMHQGLALAGAVLRPIEFIPKFQKLAEQRCGGVQIHVTNRAEFKSFHWALALLSAAKQLYPKEFSWRSGTYEFIDSVPAIDLLYGSPRFREVLESGQNLACLAQELAEFPAEFSELRKEFLLYS